MKKIITLFVFVWLVAAESNAQCRKDTIYNYVADVVTDQLELKERTINTFDSRNNIIEELKQNWDYVDNIFTNTYKTTQTFNAKNNILSSLYEQYSSGTWTTLRREFFTYLNDTLRLTLRTERPNGSGGWIVTMIDSSAYNIGLHRVYFERTYYDLAGNISSASKDIYDYISGDSVYTAISQTLDIFSATWLNNKKDSIWESNKQKIKYGHRFTWNQTISKWDINYGYIINYDNNWNPILQSNYTWNAATNVWILSQQDIIAYTTDNLISSYQINLLNATSGLLEIYREKSYSYNNARKLIKMVVKGKVSGILREVGREYYTYDGSGNLINVQYVQWNNTLSIWENLSENIYTFNSNGFMIAYEEKESWNAPLGLYRYHYKEEYKCANANVGINDLTANNLNIYPNPTNGSLTISSEKESTAYLSDLQGRAIETLSLSKGENHFDISNLNNGVYFLKIDNNVQRIIKQ